MKTTIKYTLFACVNELPGICTDAPSVDEAMKLIQEPIAAAIEFYMENNQDIPELIKEENFKGNISYLSPISFFNCGPQNKN